jgi:hypothetical protein
LQVNVLSGGEKARLALAKFMLTQGTLLVLDEPTNHLDIPSKEMLEDALKQFEGSVIAVSHDRYFLRQIATRIVTVGLPFLPASVAEVPFHLPVCINLIFVVGHAHSVSRTVVFPLLEKRESILSLRDPSLPRVMTVASCLKSRCGLSRCAQPPGTACPWALLYRIVVVVISLLWSLSSLFMLLFM